MMKTVVTTWVLVVVLFGLAGVTEAEQPSKDFVIVYATPDRLDLGTSVYGGVSESPEALTINVEANCIHGPIVVSTTELKHSGGGTVLPGDISVRSAATRGYVTMERPVAISRPEKGSHNIVLDFKVKTGFNLPGGDYVGTMTFTVMPPY